MNWYFGYNAGISFSNGTPGPLTGGAISTWEGCAGISDKNGNLLFYTDGRSIWNKKHQVIPGAIDLGGNSTTTQSGTIVPQPDDENIYYVFSIDFSGGAGGLQYAVVDMQLNNGLGGVVSKNNLLLANSSESLTVIRHCNAVDYWILAHEVGNNTFKAFLLTKDGLKPQGIESKAGVVKGAYGYMKASPDGQKVAVASFGNAFELLHFDAAHGTLSDPLLLRHPDFFQTYGLEFSPDNRFIYVTGTLIGAKKIYQLETATHEVVSMLSSKTLVAEITDSYFGALQLGPDKKIYVAINGNRFLGVINNPNLKGTECGFTKDGINLAGGISGIGLPNFIPAYFNTRPNLSIATTTALNCNDITLAASISHQLSNWEYRWFLDGKRIPGANGYNFKPAKSGSYSVSAKTIGGCTDDSLLSEPIDIKILEANPGFTTQQCNNVLLQANANAPFKWIGEGISPEEANQDMLTVSGVGTHTYTLQMVHPDNNACYLQKQLKVTFPPTESYRLKKTTFTSCDTLTLTAPINAQWDTYTWELPDHSTVNAPQVTGRQSGRYIIQVKNTQSHCVSRDTATVVIHSSPPIGSDESLCLTHPPLELRAGATGEGLVYEWLPDASKNASLSVDKAGTYQVSVTSPQGCKSFRRIHVLSLQQVTLRNTMTACEGEPIELSPTISNTTASLTYQWSSGEHEPMIKPRKSGMYTLTTKQSVCETSDSVKVTFHPSPKIRPDEVVCLDTEIEAGGQENGLNYTWLHSGETSPVISITEVGVYKVKISTSEGCAVTRTITVNRRCPPHIYAPDVFTPNHDGINDVFKPLISGGQAIGLSIYNRWGDLIHLDEQSTPYWDGQTNHAQCAEGIYPYVFRYKLRNVEGVHEYRGSILLQR